MVYCTISAGDIHCNCFSYYTINAHINRVENERRWYTVPSTPLCEGYGLADIDLRDTPL